MRTVFLLLALLFLPLAAPAQSGGAELPGVNVLAEQSLAEPLAIIARDYARDKDGTVTLEFADGQDRNTLLADNAGADVLVTLRAAWLDKLRQEGLIDIHSETPVAADSLVLAGPPQAKKLPEPSRGFPLTEMLGQMGSEPSFVIPNPETLPEGSYARAALRHLHAAAALEPYTLYVPERAQIASLILNQGAFATMLGSVARRQGMNIVMRFPAASHPPMIYRAVVLAGENMKEARRFVEYLASPEALAVFRRMGFTTE